MSNTQTTTAVTSRLSQTSATLATTKPLAEEEIKVITDEDDCAIELKNYEDVREGYEAKN